MSHMNETVKVWDPLVRIGHWVLVTAFFVAYFTEDDFLTQHVWAGYTVAGVIVFRVCWGFVGTENARFGSFVCSPRTTLSYLVAIARNQAKRYIGHNPAGGAMIVALLLALSVTTVSGLELYAIEENAGPLAAFTARNALSTDMVFADANADRYGSDSDDDNERESDEELWEEVHEVSANLTLFLVILHISGVVLASVTHRENLVKAMFTGRKRA